MRAIPSTVHTTRPVGSFVKRTYSYGMCVAPNGCDLEWSVWTTTLDTGRIQPVQRFCLDYQDARNTVARAIRAYRAGARSARS